MRTLEKLTIRNFKSIREQTLELGPLNIFIGANGAGKSNLIQVFRLLREIQQRNLATYSLQRGADSLLYLGRKASQFMEFSLEFSEDDVRRTHGVRLVPTDEGALIVGQETFAVHDPQRASAPSRESWTARNSEIAFGGSPISNWIENYRETFRLYHFHNTSDTATVKGAGDVEDNRFLRPQAENLAPFLYWLQQKKPDHFATIQDTIRQIAPFFDEFRLAPSRLNEAKIRLEWKEKGSDTYFNAFALSDGTLRFICLATLLLQPELPVVVLLDEPELGLHPAAITLLADLLTHLTH